MHVWRERLGRWFDPLARRMPLSPNAISVIALALNVTASVLLFHGRRWPPGFLIAIGFIVAGGLADALDGIVARVQGKTSRLGDFLDHCADRLSDMLLAICWLTGSGVRESLVITGVVGVMLNGYIGTQIEATFGERNYDSVGRGEFVLALIIYPLISYIVFTNGWAGLRFATLTTTEWLAAVMSLFAAIGIAQRWALALRLERGA
jgi:archaetidylinositol phosphate synthase